MSTTRPLAALVEELCGDLTRIRAPRGTELHARAWATEAPLRMLLNNLDPEVAERPEELVVYGGSGKAARNPEALRALVRSLLELGEDETLLVQSGKPVGVFRTHSGAPRVLIANAMLVPHWATWDEFRRLDIDVTLGEARVRLELSARYGLVLPEVAREAQERVADALATMCAVRIGSVDVSVEEVE